MGVLHDLFPHTDPLELALSFVLLQGALIYFLFRRLQRDRRVRWALEKKESIAERIADRADYEAQRQRDLVVAIACSPLGIELHRQAIASRDGDCERSVAWAADVLAHASALEAGMAPRVFAANVVAKPSQPVEPAPKTPRSPVRPAGTAP